MGRSLPAIIIGAHIMAGDAESWLGSIFHTDEGKDYPQDYEDYKNFGNPDYYPFKLIFFEEIEFHFFIYKE